MVIGDQHLQAQRFRRRHTADAGNTVVHRDQQLGALRGRDARQLGRQSVPLGETARYQITHSLRAKRLQREDGECGASGAVRIVITDDDDRLLCLQGLV